MRSLIKVVFVLWLLGLGSGAWAPTVLALDIGSDDATDQFIGSDQQWQGSPGNESAGGGSRDHAGAHCSHCQWMLGDPCSSQFNSFACGRVTEGCPRGQEQRRQWFSSDDGLTWQDRGLTCVGGESVVIDPGGASLLGAFARSVPTAQISVEPKSGVLPQVPAIFDSGQPQSLAPSTHLIGAVSIELAPAATWVWNFGDGSTLETGISGSHYPDSSVSHTYRRAGQYQVRLTTIWRATYRLAGEQALRVDGEITQEATSWVGVGQGRAVLTPSR